MATNATITAEILAVPSRIKENSMGWPIFIAVIIAVIIAALAVFFLLWSGEEYRKNNDGGKGLLILGITLLAISGGVVILASNEMGLGKIADDKGETFWSNRPLEENVPYLVTGVTKVRDDEHIAFVCEVQHVGAKDASLQLGVLGCANTSEWRAYRFKESPPELFIRRKDGVIQKITLEEARLLKEVGK